MSDRDYSAEDLADSHVARNNAVRQQVTMANVIGMITAGIDALREAQLDDEIGALQDAISPLEARIERLDELLAVADMIERPRGAHYRAVA